MLTVLAAGLGVGIHDTGLAGHLWRHDPLRRLAADGVADDADRPPRCCLPARSPLLAAGQAASAFAPDYAAVLALRLVDAGGRRDLHAAGGGDRRADRAGGQRRERHRLCLSRLVAGDRRRSADGDASSRRSSAGVSAFAALAALAAIHRAAVGRGAAARACAASRCRSRASASSRATGRSCCSCWSRFLQTSGQFTVFIYLSPLLDRLDRRRSRHRQRIIFAHLRRRRALPAM